MREAELLITCGTMLACVIAVLWRARPRVQVWGLTLAFLLVAPLVFAWVERRDDARLARTVTGQQPLDRTLRARSRWASSDACASCHPGAHATWRDTYHRRMTQKASDDAVLATWSGSVEDQGRTYHLLRDGDRFLVDMPKYGTTGESPDERMVRPIVLTTGSHHQQLYWLTVPWSETAKPPGAALLYAQRCASCHGPEGWGDEAGAIAEESLYLEGIDAVLTAPGHQAILDKPLSEEERVLLGELLLRMQSRDRLMQFPLAWMVKEGRWVNEEHTFLHPEPEPEPFEAYQEGWSDSCDRCHAVAARYDTGRIGDLGRSEVVDLGIACEACHGAGASHVERYSNPANRYAAHFDGAAGADDVVNPAELDAQRSAGLCGQCHAEFWHFDVSPRRAFRPGDKLEDFVRVIQYEAQPLPRWLAAAAEQDPELLESGFWRDGTIRIAGRGYNGIAISPCHTEGELDCTTCHQLHGSDPNDQLAADALTGMDACKDCHQDIAADVPAHSHHAAGSAGSDCYNCHMPHTTYGLLDAKRAHRIDSPSIEQSLVGRPNACNLCHLDKTLAEVGDHLTDWYGHPQPDLPKETTSAAVRWLVSGDAVQRAILAWHVGWAPARQASGDWWLAPLVAQLLDDPYASVRFLAGQSLQRLPGFEGFDYDYTGPLDERILRSATAVDRWSKRGDHQRDSLPLGLVRDGKLMHKQLVELDAERDDRPVTVNE